MVTITNAYDDSESNGQRIRMTKDILILCTSITDNSVVTLDKNLALNIPEARGHIHNTSFSS